MLMECTELCSRVKLSHKFILCIMLSCSENRCVAAVWLDTRTAETVDEILSRTPGHNQDHLRVIH